MAKAYHYIDMCRRTKCSDLRDHRCAGWMWYTLVFITVILPCVFARGMGPMQDSDDFSIYPSHDVYVRYGENLDVTCSTTKGNASDLVFTLGGTPLQDTYIVDSTTIRLLIIKPEQERRTTYYCKNKKTQKNDVITVTVAAPPANVTDFKCISKNFDYLNCSWTTPDLYMESKYTLIMEVNGVQFTAREATSEEYTLTRYCIFNGTTDPWYRQQVPTFTFYLVSENILGHNNQTFIINHYSVVKPDPPRNLHNISVGPHSVVLHWTIPNNIQDFLVVGIEHKIEYQIAKIDNTSYFRQVNTTGFPRNNKTYRFNLTDLPYAYMQYGVRVYIKPVGAKNEFWSEFSNLVFYTGSEKPRRPPDTAAGAFQQNAFAKYRMLRVHWKQLEEYEEAGANFTYKVIVKQGSNTQTLFPDKSKGLGVLYLEEASLDAMEISVWSFNEKGSSENSSHLYIPPESQTHSPYLTSFTKLAYENGTYELSWFGISNIDNYTLFWCQHNTSCNGRLNFTNLDGKTTKHIIDLPRDYRYHFAISANKGTRSSGMIWAKCDISKEEITMYRFPIVFTDHGAPGKSSVELRWSMDCILKDGIIIGYNISYCPVIKTSSWCDETGKVQSKYIDNPKQMNVTIENLLPYRTYQFNISLNTSYGLKKLENATVRITTLEDTPTSPRNVNISSVRNDSLVISWDQPEHLNGHISQIKYVINNFKTKVLDVRYEDNLSHKLRRYVKLDNLPSFTNFSFTVQACNEGIDSCSEPTSAISLRNCIGAPSKVRNVTIKYTPIRLEWKPPKIPGGTVDLYQIRITKDEKELPLINTTDLEHPFSQCEGSVTIETYQVRAVNFDEHKYHGAAAVSDNVSLPLRAQGDMTMLMYPGEWSEERTVNCSKSTSLFLVFIIMGVLAIIGAGCGILKVYKKLRKMRNIKPVFPKGLFIVPEKDNKYPISGLYPPDKEEKPASDETLLLPNSKTTVSTPDLKQKENDNCGSSDHTVSTVLSDASQGAIERHNSTSDDDSRSSLHLEVQNNEDANNGIQDQSPSSSDTESSGENSPYFSSTFKKNNSPDNGQITVNPVSGYVDSSSTPFMCGAPKKNNVTGYVQPVVKPLTGYVDSAPTPLTSPGPNKNNGTGYVQPVVNPLTGYVDPASTPFKQSPVSNTPVQPSGSGYVMAGLPPSIFPSGIHVPSQPPPPSGYVRAEDAHARSAMNFPQLGPSPTKLFGPESLPTMSVLPPPTKNGADSSYIQLQSLDSLPSHKPNVRNIVPLKPPASSGYVSPGDPVINKHLKNIISGGQLTEESAILDPAMSPDAYCRFSWSTDPANDNLHSLLGNSPTINSNKN